MAENGKRVTSGTAQPSCEVDLTPDDIGVDEEDQRECCSFCGKPYEDFSDLGCGHCDRRSPEWGLV